MKNLLRVIVPLLLCAAVTLACPAAAFAQAFPARPIKLIVPYPAGGGTDIAGRWVAQLLSKQLGQQVYVDNVSGANGNLGTDQLAKAPPDGYTIGMSAPGPIAIGRSLYPDLPYDPMTAFAAIALVNESPNVLVVNPALPVKSLKELVALAKSKPGKLTAALVSAGSIPHLLTEMLKISAGIDLLDVPYKGGGPAVLDVIGGQVDMLFSVVPLVMPNINAGQLRPIAIASPVRTALMPDVPSTAEEGYPDVVGTAWNGISAPAGTPSAVVNKLNAEILKVLALPETKERFAQLGMETRATTPESFSAFLRSESEKWAKVIKAAHVTMQ